MTKQIIIIRKFESNDIFNLADLTNQLGYYTTVEQMRVRMDKILRLSNYWTFVALTNEKVVGYIGLTKNYFWEQDGEYLKVQALVVDTKFRTLGVGQKLIDMAEQVAKQNNINILLLNCGNRDERQSAHRFYQKVGFEPKSTGYIKRLENNEPK